MWQVELPKGTSPGSRRCALGHIEGGRRIEVLEFAGVLGPRRESEEVLPGRRRIGRQPNAWMLSAGRTGVRCKTDQERQKLANSGVRFVPQGGVHRVR